MLARTCVPEANASRLFRLVATLRSKAQAWLTLFVVYLRMALLILRKRPYKLTLLVTDGCNLRCQMCSIWKREYTYLTVDEVKEIWSAFGSKPCWINISGGEPSLNRQLGEVLAFFAGLNRSLLITITTNGQIDISRVLEPILKAARKCAVFVSVSTDGNEATHDEIRGHHGAFARASRTTARLRELARRYPALNVGLSVTLSRTNLDQFVPFVCEQIKTLPVSVNLAQSSAYYGNDELEAFTTFPKTKVIEALRLVQHLQPKFAFDAILKVNYLERTLRFLEGKPSLGRCASIDSNVLVSSHLDIMDCSLKFRPWDARNGSRDEKLRRLVAVVRNPVERHDKLTCDIRRERCERTCYTPCENYVHLMADLLCPWRAPRLIACFLARSLESWFIGRKRLGLAIAQFHSANARVTLPVVACESAEP